MADAKPRDLCERTFLFSRDIVRFCMILSRQPGASRQISGQLLRAGTSVGGNAEEARAAYSRREFACKNNVVLKEARESRFWLRLVIATGLTPEGYEQTTEALRQEADELVGIYTASVRSTRASLTTRAK